MSTSRRLLTQCLRQPTTLRIASTPLAHQPFIARHSLIHRQQSVRMASSTTHRLNTGATIPAVGFGTWQDKDAQADAVYEALKAGYRHIDTAAIYGTEPGVAAGIKRSGVPRSEIFITTKLWNNSHRPGDVAKALDASLAALETDYVDLYLMHWPSAFKPGGDLIPKDAAGKIETDDVSYLDTWHAMEKLDKTKARAIGISNFSQGEVEDLLLNSKTVPAAHQLEMHPYLQQPAFRQFHADKGIHLTHYSPFGNSNEIYSSGKSVGKLIEDPVLVEVGKKHGGRSGAQVALAWGVQLGHSVIPKSKTPARIAANFALDFELDADDMRRVAAVDRKLRFNNPSDSFGYQYYTGLDGA